ncbi:ABC transporter substrate-binding protein [Pseudonocardia spinosispora]|uniref:ABC transporter substrate-binding protein n=1 Tax=Pseudonocardia spinosispora TaxID=103441 RepID=UPI0004272323|nr:ABC transporter substrate-binding protein [Pseudonocardia spinosispora]
MRRAGHGARWLLLAVVLAVLAGCSNTPPPQTGPLPPPPPPVNPANPMDGSRQMIVGVDDLGPGFNPHLISDLSDVSTAVASLVLPSVFRPAKDGQLLLDPTVASSAKVTSTAPFTVSYELALGASWSDNAPIAAEDFVYLWQRMRAEPGVQDSAGYRLITDVRSRAGGKAVDVVFSQPYQQWQTLFSNLLPAHVLKDAPQGWRGALAESIPLSGGPFLVLAVDRARGQIVLARNDHYWATPAALDSLVLRRSDTTSMLDGLRGGDLPIVQTWADANVATALQQLGSSARVQKVAQPIMVQLGMRTDQGVLTDVRIRQAVGAILNRDTLINIGTGNGAGGVRDDAQLLAPSEPGYHPTAPAGAPIHPDPALAARLLTSAGYVRDAAGKWTLLGAPLKITVGVPSGRDRFTEIGMEIQRQLTAAGVEATLVTAAGASLFADPTVVPVPPTTSPSASPSASAGPPLATAAEGARPLATGGGQIPAGLPAQPGMPAQRPGQRPAPTPSPAALSTTVPSTPPGPSSSAAAAPAPAGVTVDLEVMPRSVGGDLATTAVSNYGCPPGMAGVAQPARNPTGFCLTSLQPTLDAALTGGLSPAQASAAIETVLWQQLPTIPLFQIVTTVASTPKGDDATGHIGAGPLTVGPFGSAASWQAIPKAPR